MTEEVKEVLEEVVVEEPKAPVSHGTKEIEEVIKALDLVAEFAAKLFADGKVDGNDFVHVVALLQKADVFVDAVKDVKVAGDELKDVDEQELIKLGLAGYALAKKVIAAVKLAKA